MVAAGACMRSIIVAVAAFVAVLGAATTPLSTHAAWQLPATYYGRANPGDEISALIDGTLCANTIADDRYEWVIRVPTFACGGKAVGGATVTFSVNGYNALHTETWRNGATQSDLIHGISPGRYVAASAGDSHICALTADGEIACWGENMYGQLDVPHGRYTAISSGGSTNCALTAEGEAVCWGLGSAQFEVPPAKRGSGYVAVSAGWYGWCALDTAGQVTCVVSTSDGTPYSPPGRYAALSAGGHQVCGVTKTS